MNRNKNKNPKILCFQRIRLNMVNPQEKQNLELDSASDTILKVLASLFQGKGPDKI